MSWCWLQIRAPRWLWGPPPCAEPLVWDVTVRSGAKPQALGTLPPPRRTADPTGSEAFTGLGVGNRIRRLPRHQDGRDWQPATGGPFHSSSQLVATAGMPHRQIGRRDNGEAGRNTNGVRAEKPVKTRPSPHPTRGAARLRVPSCRSMTGDRIA